jgi:hypothetical protein
MDQQTATLVVAGLGIAGTLAGAIVGNAFQARGQHQQWRRDNVCQECRELLGQLSVNRFAFIDWRKSIEGLELGPQAAIFAKQYSDAVLDLHRNFRSRILIAEELKRANIPNRWDAALNSFDGDLKKLNAECDLLAEEIAKIGLKV